MNKVKKVTLVLGALLLFAIYGFAAAKMISTFDNWRVKRSEELLIQSQNVDSDKEKLLLLQQAALLNPNERNYLKTAVFAKELGLDLLAESYLKRVKTADGYFELGNAYFNQGKYEEAFAAYKKAYKKKMNAEYLKAQGKAKMHLDKPLEAQTLFEESRDLVKNDTENNDLLTLIWLVNNAEAKSITPISNDSVVLANLKGESLVNEVHGKLNAQNYPQLATSYLKEAANRGPVSRDAYLTLGKLYFEERNYQMSYDLVLAARRKDEFYPQTYRQLIQVATKLGKTAEVKEYEAKLATLTW